MDVITPDNTIYGSFSEGSRVYSYNPNSPTGDSYYPEKRPNYIDKDARAKKGGEDVVVSLSVCPETARKFQQGLETKRENSSWTLAHNCGSLAWEMLHEAGLVDSPEAPGADINSPANVAEAVEGTFPFDTYTASGGFSGYNESGLPDYYQ